MKNLIYIRKYTYRMKYSWIIYTLAYMSLTISVVAQWTTQSPVPTHLDIRGIGAPTDDHIFIATTDDPFDSGGALFESIDGGLNWVQREVPQNLSDPLNGMFFYDSNHGWVYGNVNYRTVDGGTTWDELPFLGSTYFMEFYSPTFGITTGNFGAYFSNDGGLSWNPTPNQIFKFSFSDSTVALGISNSGIYRTIDDWLTVSQVLTGNGDDVLFLSNNIAIGIVDNSFVRSIDAGINWTNIDTTYSRNKLFKINSNIVLAWGRSGSLPDYDDRILRSVDGGLSWLDLGEVIPQGVHAITKVNSQTLVASDLQGNIYQSIDAGQTWINTFTSPGLSPSFLSSAKPAFADSLTGYFGYGSGFIIKSIDGGSSWSQISSGNGQTLNDIERFSNGSMIAVGNNGTFLKSDDGSAPWIINSAFSQNDNKAIHIINDNEVVVLDELGQVYKSADGGITWISAGSTPSNLSPAEDIHFNSLADGWVVGQGAGAGALFHTTDGGNTWTAAPGFTGAYVALDIEGTSIWAVNVTGRYYYSSDSGANWNQGDLPGSVHQIQDMDFYDDSTGYAVGWYGEVFRSDDGGVSWQVLPTQTSTVQFTDTYLISSEELWISTNDNMVYYSNNGGQNWAALYIGSNGFGNFETIIADSSGNAWTIGDHGFIEYFNGPPPLLNNQPPNASFNYSTVGLTVDFTNTSTDPDGVIVSWSWDFGDSSFSNLQNPTHTYTSANTYIVKLTVTDDSSASDSTVRFIVVQPGPGGTFGDFTEVTPLDSLFVTPQNEDFWVITTAPVDFDSDGDLDVAVLGYYVVYNHSVEERLVLLRNDGQAGSGEWDFTYIDVPLGTISAGSSDLSWGDADNDGDQDLVVASDGQTVIYRNDAGSLVLTDTNLPPYWEDNLQADFDLRSVTWADYDNDGDQDLLIPSAWNDNTFSYRTALMRNDGLNGTGGWIFTEVDSVFAPTIHAQSAWADFDNDQDLDLLLVHISPLGNDGFIRRYRNDGGGSFTGEDILDSLTVEHGEAQWGDYDSDGDLDILIAGHIKENDGSYNTVLRIYRNDAETYVPVNIDPGSDWFDLTAATWADYDSDGDMDILLAGNYNSGSQIEGRARIYTNNGGIFTGDTSNTLPAPRASGSRGGTFSWLDIDGDMDLDYFIAGQYFVPGGNGLVEAQMHVYRNDGTGQNLPPTAPEGLTSITQPDSSILLSWLPASDDLTPSTALTYDIEIFQINIPVNLPQRIPQPGNVSAVTQWQLSGLPDGQYVWTVRAVDNAYNGGVISQGVFDVGTVSSIGNNDVIPKAFEIFENYPNPFNPSTTFSFNLPEKSLVTLIVYDVQGREVTKIINGNIEAGKHKVLWKTHNLASGHYFVRFTANQFSKTQKIILLK